MRLRDITLADSAYRLGGRKCQMQLVQLVRAPDVLVECPDPESDFLDGHLGDLHFQPLLLGLQHKPIGCNRSSGNRGQVQSRD
jgi:hypothetical protein